MARHPRHAQVRGRGCSHGQARDAAEFGITLQMRQALELEVNKPGIVAPRNGRA